MKVQRHRIKCHLSVGTTMCIAGVQGKLHFRCTSVRIWTSRRLMPPTTRNGGHHAEPLRHSFMLVLKSTPEAQKDECMEFLLMLPSTAEGLGSAEARSMGKTSRRQWSTMKGHGDRFTNDPPSETKALYPDAQTTVFLCEQSQSSKSTESTAMGKRRDCKSRASNLRGMQVDNGA